MMQFRTAVILLAGITAATSPTVADTVDIREWLVPWEESAPTDAWVDAGGRVWFVGSRGDYVANFSQQTGEFNRYDLRKGAAPAALLIDENRSLWFASNRRRYIGILNPGTGRITEVEMPDRKAKELRSLAFDRNGDVWFTAEDGNLIGMIDADNMEVALIPLGGRNARPFGIAIDSANIPWVAASGRNALFRIDPVTLSAEEIPIPDEKSRPRRIVITSDDQVWYTDHELGALGRYDARTQQFTRWSMPGGENSRPYGMAADRNDRIWIVETGSTPNRLVGFDTGLGSFLTETDIPSGAGSVSHLHYVEAAGEIWFGTETNYIGRAKIH